MVVSVTPVLCSGSQFVEREAHEIINIRQYFYLSDLSRSNKTRFSHPYDITENTYHLTIMVFMLILLLKIIDGFPENRCYCPINSNAALISTHMHARTCIHTRIYKYYNMCKQS